MLTTFLCVIAVCVTIGGVAGIYGSIKLADDFRIYDFVKAQRNAQKAFHRANEAITHIDEQCEFAQLQGDS